MPKIKTILPDDFLEEEKETVTDETNSNNEEVGKEENWNLSQSQSLQKLEENLKSIESKYSIEAFQELIRKEVGKLKKESFIQETKLEHTKHAFANPDDPWQQIYSYSDTKAKTKTVTEVLPAANGSFVKVIYEKDGFAPSITVTFAPHVQFKDGKPF